MESDGLLLENLINAIRAQMKALDQYLSLLEVQLKTATESKQTEHKPPLKPPIEIPLCPWCKSSDIYDLQVMGTKPLYGCKKCDFRGEIC